jgi:hypothetical protein
MPRESALGATGWLIQGFTISSSKCLAPRAGLLETVNLSLRGRVACSSRGHSVPTRREGKWQMPPLIVRSSRIHSELQRSGRLLAR